MNVYITNNNLSYPRLGIKITKNAIHLAVVRNMVKRRIFAEFRERTNVKSIDIIVIISKKIYSEKNEISDILMHEWKQSLKLSKKFY